MTNTKNIRCKECSGSGIIYKHFLWHEYQGYCNVCKGFGNYDKTTYTRCMVMSFIKGERACTKNAINDWELCKKHFDMWINNKELRA